MELPQALRAALLAADEEYLIALSNKGTVNRAKKDLAAAQPVVQNTGEGTITVALGDTVCSIAAPLGSSTCSCPSSTMCRHRITAMLWLKEQADAPSEEEDCAPEKAAEAQPQEDLSALLTAFPSDQLIRQLGERRAAALVQRETAGEGAAIREGSAVTVELPWVPATVRFIVPLEHSSCTCHSQSFCIHKAEALLTWQLRRGVVAPESLLADSHSNSGSETDRREICASIQDTLMDWMRTGLSRLPASVQDTAERLAGLCHVGGLPALERSMRRLHGELQGYFSHSAAFRTEGLLRRMSAVWRLAAALQRAQEQEALALAGTFRDEYRAAGKLQLYLLGLRTVDLPSGYAGTVYYFWDMERQCYYTYRDLRPKFYEGRRRPGPAETIVWELPGTLRQAWNCRVNLTDARLSGEGNLSSTAQCRGTLLQKCPPGAVIPAASVEEDFSRLLPRSQPGRDELHRLAILRPARWERQAYNQVEQRFTLRLMDSGGRDIWLTVRYRDWEKDVVEALEELARRWEQTPDLRPVFFGELYREEGRLCLYPIECFADWEGKP